jgi:hypothetical protein
MRGYVPFILLLFILILFGACKKEAPYIDSLVGTYKVSGIMYYDTIPIRTFHDTLLSITKADDWTLNFSGSGCDTGFWPVSLTYDWENDTVILYFLTFQGDHSPNSASLFFHRPLNGSFTYWDQFYCGQGFVGSSLRGVKVH